MAAAITATNGTMEKAPSGASVGELRAARKKAGLTQSDAAAALGCSVTAISRLETGKRKFRQIAERYREWVANGLPVDAAPAVEADGSAVRPCLAR